MPRPPTRTTRSGRCGPGLRICARRAAELQRVGGAPLRLRVGVNTGEALVRLGASAEFGGAVCSPGTSINTRRTDSVGCARDGGRGRPRDLSRRRRVVFDYDELAAGDCSKGKPSRSGCSMRNRPGSARHRSDPHARDARWSGERSTLAILKGIFEKSVAAASGAAGDGGRRTGAGQEPPGRRAVRATSMPGPELVTWRQGRCLPYGEGVTFWALGEILKAETGILESDPPDGRLGEAGARVCRRRRRSGQWLRAAPAAARSGSAGASSRGAGGVVHGLAEIPGSNSRSRVPTVLVFEDLHWADEALLAFLEQLADLVRRRAAAAGRHGPARALGASPGLRGDGCATQRRSTSPPLSRGGDGPADLGAARARRCCRPSCRSAILDRAGGNPLYAEEFVRLLGDRG